MPFIAQAHGEAPPFISVNCAALATAMVESELFGHRRGAFTGADTARQVYSNRHTAALCFSMKSEMSLTTQAKMLRVVEEKAVRPVGDIKAHSVDVRVVAATNRNLEEAVSKGHFRRPSLPPIGTHHSSAAYRIPSHGHSASFFHFLNEQLSKMPGAQRRLWRAADADAPAIPFTFFKSLMTHSWRRNVREIRKAAIDTAASNQGPDAVRFNVPQLEDSYRSQI